MPPAKDSVIAERKAEDMNAYIPERITHSVNPFAPRQPEPKATTSVRIFAQDLRNFVQGTSRRDRVSMQEPEYFATRDLSSGIHLLRAPARGL
jgi:hypothetical protein